MQNPRLAARYSKSLLDLSVEQNQVDTVLADIQLLDNVCLHSKDFSNMLRSPIIKADKKLAIIEAVLGSKLSALTKGFIKLLVNKGREANLPEMAHAFIGQYKELKNIKTVKITTASPLNEAVKNRILQNATATVSNSKVDLVEAVDADLIGGFVLEMDDKLFDASIRRDLQEVRAQFTKNIYVSQIR
jgi:F-type H+-transporting ATPase subunit delta